MSYINVVVVNSLVVLLNGYKNRNERGLNYLIGQTIRQYVPDDAHTHYTKGFDKLWHSLTNAEIFGSYDESCEYSGEHDITLRCYTGSSNEYTEKVIKAGKKFKWNDIFHYEHTITVDSIREKLYALDVVSYDTVKAILDTMHVTRMTKEENISLHNKTNRSDDFDTVVKNLYNARGVYLYEQDEEDAVVDVVPECAKKCEENDIFKGFVFKGCNYSCKTYTGVFKGISRILYAENRGIIDAIVDKKCGDIKFTTEPIVFAGKYVRSHKFDKDVDIYLYDNFNAVDLVRLSYELIEMYGYEKSDFALVGFEIC